jgi:hypothetical protein
MGLLHHIRCYPHRHFHAPDGIRLIADIQVKEYDLMFRLVMIPLFWGTLWTNNAVRSPGRSSLNISFGRSAF